MRVCERCVLCWFYVASPRGVHCVLWRDAEINYTRCGNKETGLLLLLISGHVDDEEEGRALIRGLPSTVTQRFIHAHPLVWP